MTKFGCQEPTFCWVAEYAKTEGHFAAELSTCYALRPHPWQEAVLCDWLAVDSQGCLLNNTCVLEVPRQNGKTGISDPRETWGLIKRGEHILHTAQEFQTAKKAFDRLRKKFGTRKNDPFAEYPELNALVDHYTVSAGQMVLDLTNGGHIEFRTRGNNADMGRGGTFDLVVIDEAQAYTEAQDAALSPLNSAAPSGSPQTILMGTPPIPTSGDKGLIFARIIDKMHNTPDKGSCIHEWGVESVGDVTDRERWYRVNPSLGFQLLEKALAKDVETMSADTFAREHLGLLIRRSEKAQLDAAIEAEAWAACASLENKPEGKTAYGIKFTADGSEVILAGAVIPKVGKARISLIERRHTVEGVRWLADWLNVRYDQAACVVIDGKNGVDVLIDRISGTWRAKNSVIRLSARDYISAVGLLINEINEQALTWYKPQEQLNISATTSTRRNIGGSGWGFGGEDSAPIEACALALWGAKNARRDPSRKMRIG